jgi:hypothetical protein
VSDIIEKLDAYADQETKTRYPDGPTYHPDDVRFYLAISVLVFTGLMLALEAFYAMFFRGADSLQSVLDAFGLFDAMFMTLAGAIMAFYFSDRRRED